VGARGSVAVLSNQGDGTFSPPLRIPFGSCAFSLLAADFDQDAFLDLALGIYNGVAVLPQARVVPTSLDLNHNGIPDECDPGVFHRGDPNSSGTADIADGITIFGFLFLGNPTSLPCKESADANNDGAIDISDGIFLLSWLYSGGPEPAAPGSTRGACGFDPDPLGSAADLGCESYNGCN
jgi:hypothetical protein